MSEPPNPFALNPFEGLNTIRCSRCNVELRPEEARYKVKAVILEGILSDDEDQVRSYYCEACLKIVRRQERRQLIIAVVVIGAVLLLALLSQRFR